MQVLTHPGGGGWREMCAEKGPVAHKEWIEDASVYRKGLQCTREAALRG